MGDRVDTKNAMILHRHGDGIFALELNRPAKRNALTLEMWQLLIAHLRTLERTDCRAIILSGRGDHFCSGADIASLGSSKDGQTTRTARPKGCIYCVTSASRRSPP